MNYRDSCCIDLVGTGWLQQRINMSFNKVQDLSTRNWQVLLHFHENMCFINLSFHAFARQERSLLGTTSKWKTAGATHPTRNSLARARPRRDGEVS